MAAVSAAQGKTERRTNYDCLDVIPRVLKVDAFVNLRENAAIFSHKNLLRKYSRRNTYWYLYGSLQKLHDVTKKTTRQDVLGSS